MQIGAHAQSLRILAKTCAQLQPFGKRDRLETFPGAAMSPVAVIAMREEDQAPWPGQQKAAQGFMVRGDARGIRVVLPKPQETEPVQRQAEGSATCALLRFPDRGLLLI